MKKIIALTIIAVLLLQMNLPVLSLAINEEENETNNDVEINKEEIAEQKELTITDEDKEDKDEERTLTENNLKEEFDKKVESEKQQIQNNKKVIIPEVNSKVLEATDPNTKVELDSRIKSQLISDGIDKDEDGEFTAEELKKVYWLYIYCDDKFVDFSGLEYMTNLSTLSLSNVSEDTDLAVLSSLPLDTLYISGFLNNISFLENLPGLSELSISLWGDLNPFDILEKITQLQSLYLYYNGDIDTAKLSKINELKHLRIQCGEEIKSINIYPLANSENLISLGLENFDLENLNGLENLEKLESLSLRVPSESSLDTYTISNLSNLKELTIEDYIEDISWINNLTNLNSLRLEYSNKGIEMTSEYLETINSLSVPNIDVEGSIIYNIGELTANEQKEISFDNIPIIKEMQNPNSKLYYEDFIYGCSDDDIITVDETNKKILITPKENDKRSVQIQFNNGIGLDIQWSFEGDSEEPTLGKKLRQVLINYNADRNNDDILSKTELESEYLTYLYIEFYNGETPDLTGIENIKYLRELYIFSYGDIDLSEIKNLQYLNRLRVSGNNSSIDSLDGATQIRHLTLSTSYMSYNLNCEIINKMSNLESLELTGLNEIYAEKIGQMDNLKNLKKLLLSFMGYPGSDPVKVENFSKFTNLEELSISHVYPSDLTALEDMPNLKKLSLEYYSSDGNTEVDTNTLVKLTKLEYLKITMPNDVSWMNQLPNLTNVVLVLRNNGNQNLQINEKFINKIKSIDANVTLQGSLDSTIGNMKIGEEKDFNINDNILIKELNNPESNLYKPSVYMSFTYYDSNNECTYNEETKQVHVKVNSFGSDYGYSYISGTDNMSLNINFKWRGIYPGDTEEEIHFNDKNLENALLENYDIDNDGRLTEHDLINIDELNLDNKGIEDITGLEKATNAYYIILSNNKIKNAKVAADISTSRDRIFINLNNNEIEDVIHMKDAYFERISLNGNYIDFSEGSENRKIIVDFYGRMYDENYNEYKDYYSTKEEFINQNIGLYFQYYGANQKAKTTYKRGDVNGDKDADLIDCALLLRHAKGIELLDDEQVKRADVNNDGDVDLIDYALLLRHVKGIQELD